MLSMLPLRIAVVSVSCSFFESLFRPHILISAYIPPSAVHSIAALPSETTHARQTAANANQSYVYKKLPYTSAV